MKPSKQNQSSKEETRHLAVRNRIPELKHRSVGHSLLRRHTRSKREALSHNLVQSQHRRDGVRCFGAHECHEATHVITEETIHSKHFGKRHVGDSQIPQAALKAGVKMSECQNVRAGLLLAFRRPTHQIFLYVLKAQTLEDRSVRKLEIGEVPLGGCGGCLMAIGERDFGLRLHLMRAPCGLHRVLVASSILLALRTCTRESGGACLFSLDRHIVRQLRVTVKDYEWVAGLLITVGALENKCE